MNASKRALKTFLIVFMGTLLLTFALPVYSSASAHASIQGSHPHYRINPGEEKIIPFPQKNDPKFTIHIKSTISASSSLIANALPCHRGITEETYGVNGFGLTAWSYSITVSFCYDGTNVTSMTSPPTESTYTIWGFSLSHHASSTEYRSYGIALGNFHESSALESRDGYVEIDVEGDGSYYTYWG